MRTKSGRGGRPDRAVKHTAGADEAYKDNILQRSENTAGSDSESLSTEDDIREAIRTVLLDNTAMLATWLEQIGQENPSRALSLYKDLTEFVVPKLQRTDSKIDPSNPVQIIFESVDAYADRKKAEKAAQAARQEQKQ